MRESRREVQRIKGHFNWADVKLRAGAASPCDEGLLGRFGEGFQPSKVRCSRPPRSSCSEALRTQSSDYDLYLRVQMLRREYIAGLPTRVHDARRGMRGPFSTMAPPSIASSNETFPT
jgi:hypothetical protein